MATTQVEFKELADELKEEFQDFFISRQFAILGEVDQLSGVKQPSVTGNVEALREEYDIRQKDNQLISMNDFKLLLLNSDWVAAFPADITPMTNGLMVNVDGNVCNVISAEADPATATWILQVRG